MKMYAIIWIVVGAAMTAAALYILLSQGFGSTSTTLIATFGCIGLPFVAFGIWGLYAELKPYHYERRTPKQ